MLKAVCDVVDVPVIASGGAGCIEHFKTLFHSLTGLDPLDSVQPGVLPASLGEDPELPICSTSTN